MADPVRESIKQVDENTWLIGDLILHSSSGPSDVSSWYDSTDNLSYTLTNAPVPLPPTVPLPTDNPRIVLVYDVAERSSIANDVFC